MFDEADLAAIRSAHERWRDEALDRHEERKSAFTTVSGTTVDQLYTPLSAAEQSYPDDIGFPGEPPFTRGVYPTMYRGRLWTMRQFAGFGSAEETNARFQYLVEEGQTGLSVAFDMPTLMGIDSDDAMAAGEVGKEGVAVDTLRDMELLFDGIDLSDVSTSFTINPSAPVIYAMYVALADYRGIPRSQVRGTLQNDMFKEFIAQKEWVIPPKPSTELVTDVIEFSTDETPQFHPISISGYHIREAGSTAVQELAFTLANGCAYIESCVNRGMNIDAFAPRLSFFFNCHNSMFEEVAKFRAARRMYAQIMQEWYGADTDAARRLKFHTQTAGQSLTAQQPLNNVVRVTLQALAAVLGGTQSLHTNSFDEALALPTEEAVRVALRTQQIIAEESGAADIVDPLGGSWAVEALTNDMEHRCWDYLESIRDRGSGSMLDGVLDGIAQGYFQREIQAAAFEYQRRVDRGEEVVIGVNQFASETDHTAPATHSVDEAAVRERQLARLESVKRDRDRQAVTTALDALDTALEHGENSMPHIVDAVKAYATMGEIMEVFTARYGTYEEPHPVL